MKTRTRWSLALLASFALVAGGLLFITVQINHPHLDATFTTTTEYAVRETMKIFMAVFSLIGITGIYLRQVRQVGVLGLIGYVVLSVGYLAIFCNQIIGVFVLPVIAASNPGFVNDVLAVATSRPPVGDIGPLQIFIQGGGFAYILGSIIFGIALFRAAILARWAAALLAVGGVAILATFVLPELIQRLFAVPVSVALVGLGFSLWREQRTQKAQSLSDPVGSQLDPTSVK